MSIPSILWRAANTAGQHFAGPGRPWPVLMSYDHLEITMRPGLFRPRFYVSYSPHDYLNASPCSVLDELRYSIILSATVPTPGTLSEWLTYQGWLSGREYEALRNETH